MNYITPGSSVHGISQARKLEWVAISFSITPKVAPRVTLYCSARIHTRISKGKSTWGEIHKKPGLRFHMSFQGKGHDDNMSLPWTTCDSTRVAVVSPSVMSDSVTPWTAADQASCLSLSSRVCSNSCLLFQWCRLLLSPSPPALSLFQHQGLSQWVGSLLQVAKVLELYMKCCHPRKFSWV